MLAVTPHLSIPDNEIEITAVRASGTGGQNVNKVASAVHLRFDIRASGLSRDIQDRLLESNDRRISKDGVVVIKAREHRTFEQNRDAARLRLARVIRDATVPLKKRKSTRVSRSARNRRMDIKSRRGRLKESRRKVRVSDG